MMGRESPAWRSARSLAPWWVPPCGGSAPWPLLGIVGGMVLALVLLSVFGSSFAGVASGSPTPAGSAHVAASSTACVNKYYYGSSRALTLKQVVDCALHAGFSSALTITFVSMAYQESNFCPGAIESGSGTCFARSPGCNGPANAEGILQEGTSGQCPPAGGAFPVSGYTPSTCSSYAAHGWGGVYFTPKCAFQWAHAYYNVNGYAFWGSYLTGAYCNWAPNGFHGTGSVTCSGAGQNQAALPWSTVCPGNVCKL
jgi:hypothetical protein